MQPWNIQGVQWIQQIQLLHMNCSAEEMDENIRRGILSNYIYDRFGYLNVSTSHNGVTYKYVMLPVYVGNYRYNKKAYNFYVNGENGKVNG